MPTLTKCEAKAKPEWVKLEQTHKKLQTNDVYVLGHTEIQMPAVDSKSNIKGVKARLVKVKGGAANRPPSSNQSDVEVIKEWEFEEDAQSKPIFFSSPVTLDRDFWIEMMNPSKDQDAVVNALVHGMIRSKGR